MCNHLAVTFRICLYAHCKVCPYDTSCECREMVYFHTNDSGNLCGNNLFISNNHHIILERVIYLEDKYIG